jgi:hypothetical protein
MQWTLRWYKSDTTVKSRLNTTHYNTSKHPYSSLGTVTIIKSRWIWWAGQVESMGGWIKMRTKFWLGNLKETSKGWAFKTLNWYGSGYEKVESRSEQVYESPDSVKYGMFFASWETISLSTTDLLHALTFVESIPLRYITSILAYVLPLTGDPRWSSGWGTALQTGRSRDRFPMVSLEFFIDTILPAAIWSWGRLSL